MMTTEFLTLLAQVTHRERVAEAEAYRDRRLARRRPTRRGRPGDCG